VLPHKRLAGIVSSKKQGRKPLLFQWKRSFKKSKKFSKQYRSENCLVLIFYSSFFIEKSSGFGGRRNFYKKGLGKPARGRTTSFLRHAPAKLGS